MGFQRYMMEKGDTTGPQSAQYVLRDPTVEFAVLETAGGILRSDLASVFDIGITYSRRPFRNKRHSLSGRLAKVKRLS
jgi:hypothetical protein